VPLFHQTGHEHDWALFDHLECDGFCWQPQGKLMSDKKFLTAEEVSDRYRGSVSVGTLRNWRAMKIGPTFVKIGKAVLYPTNELDAWDQENTKGLNGDGGKEA
jgi:hypothetical protein